MKSKLYRWSVFSLVIAILLSTIMACAPSPEEAAPSPIEITDQLGRTVRLDSIPQRILSLSPGNTEILFALGLDDSLVAVTDYCDFPPEAKEKPSIGGFSTPNIEEVIALSPDLVLAASIHEKRVIPQLEGKGIDVFVLAPKTLDEVLAAITLVGEIAGKEEAAVLVAEMQKRIKAVTDKTATMPMEQRPSTCYLVWHDPLMIAGYVTLQDELIEKAGGINIVSMLSSYYATELTDYAKISPETFIAANPAVIIAGAGHGSGADQTFQYAKTESRLRDTDARKNNRIYSIDANLASRPGPRIVDALEKFAQFIHPELFTGGS